MLELAPISLLGRQFVTILSINKTTGVVEFVGFDFTYSSALSPL